MPARCCPSRSALLYALPQAAPHSKDGSLAPRALSFDCEPASSEEMAGGEAAAAAAAAPAVSVSLEGGANGEIKLSLLSFYAGGQPTL